MNRFPADLYFDWQAGVGIVLVALLFAVVAYGVEIGEWWERRGKK